MQAYIVSVDVVTSLSVAESEMTTLFGVSPTDCGQMEKEEDAFFWSYESALEQTEELGDHIESIASQIHPSCMIGLDERIRAIALNIGMMFDTFTTTAILPAQSLAVLRSKIPEFDIEIHCYPTTFGEDAEEDAS